MVKGGSRGGTGPKASGERLARRVTMERIASRRARWHTIHRPQRDAPCTRCDGVYAGHDLVLSPVGVVCESCETAIQIDFEAKLSSREAVAEIGRAHV